MIEIWVRAKSLFSSRARRAPRQKSDSWWSGLFHREDAGATFDSEQRTPRRDHLTVQDVLRRGAMARDTELLEIERAED